MKRHLAGLLALAVLFVGFSQALMAQKPWQDWNDPEFNHQSFHSKEHSAVAKERTAALQVAIERGDRRVGQGVDNYPNHRDCFSCHHQAVPLFAMSLQSPNLGVGQGIWGDQESRRDRIVEFSKKSLERELATLKPEEELGGRGMTLGYALWTMGVSRSDWGKLSDDLVSKAISTQQADGRWRIHSVRPPAASSEFMATALVMFGLHHYEQQGATANSKVSHKELAKAKYRAVLWRVSQPEPSNTEDLCGAIWFDYLALQTFTPAYGGLGFGAPLPGAGATPQAVPSGLTAPALKTTDGADSPDWNQMKEILSCLSEKKVQERRKKLLAMQNSDGGWGYEPGRQSDAYSTATSLLILAQTERQYKLPSVYQSLWFRYGVGYLLRTQQPDGSWHVSSVANPVQEYFDNGDPHETDQFISMQATAWALAALASAYHQHAEPLSVRPPLVR